MLFETTDQTRKGRESLSRTHPKNDQTLVSFLVHQYSAEDFGLLSQTLVPIMIADDVADKIHFPFFFPANVPFPPRAVSRPLRLTLCPLRPNITGW